MIWLWYGCVGYINSLFIGEVLPLRWYLEHHCIVQLCILFTTVAEAL